MKTVAPLFTKATILSSIFTAFSVVKINAQTYFDYDTKADPGVFRPSEGNWYSLSSETQVSTTTRRGLWSDRLVPADYNGDGFLSDLAVFRSGRKC